MANMSLVMRKPTFCICEYKDADQLRSNCAADLRLCFRYTDSTIPLLPKSKIKASSYLLWLQSLVCVGPGQKPRRPVFSQRGSYFMTNLNERILAEATSQTCKLTNARLDMLPTALTMLVLMPLEIFQVI